MSDLLSFDGFGDESHYGRLHDLTFTISNGQVTGISEQVGSQTVNLHIPSSAAFQVGTGQITETLGGHGQSTVITYSTESANPALYEVSNVTTTVTNPTTSGPHGTSQGFSFTIANGAVTGEQRVEAHGTHSHSSPVHLAPDAAFIVGAGTVTETLAQGNSYETITYAQPAGSNLYAVSSVSTSFVDPGSSATKLFVQPNDRMEFTIDSTGTVTGESRVDAHGGVHAITPETGTTFTQLDTGLVEMVSTEHGHTSYHVFYTDPAAGGVYTEVAHGPGSTVDVTGLEAQLNQLPAPTLHLL